MREQTFQCLLKPHSCGASWRDKKLPAGGTRPKVPTGLSINQTRPDVPQSPPAAFCKIVLPHRREAIDKALKMGYSKDTKGAASRRLPFVTEK